jgi:hypothetical protein
MDFFTDEDNKNSENDAFIQRNIRMLPLQNV